ncbi:1485_t:CDS:1, partial [Scutellospora calospora]
MDIEKVKTEVIIKDAREIDVELVKLISLASLITQTNQLQTTKHNHLILVV